MPPKTAKTHEWKQSGFTSFWRYIDNTRNYPGWHFVLDEFARSSLLSLLSAFVKDSQKLHRTISNTRPTEQALRLPNNQSGRARFFVPTGVRLEHDPTDPQMWSIKLQQDTLVWILGRDYVNELIAALRNQDDVFDCSFGGEPSVWFWGVLNTRQQP